MAKYFNDGATVKIEGGRYIVGKAPTIEEAEKIVKSFNNFGVSKTILNRSKDDIITLKS